MTNDETLGTVKTVTLPGGITAEIVTPGKSILVEYVGQEWCRPSQYWASNGVDYSGAIAITANAGTLILCNVTRYSDGKTSNLKYTPVKAEELHVQNADLTW